MLNFVIKLIRFETNLKIHSFTWLRMCDDPWEKGMFQDVHVEIQVFRT